MLQIIMYLPIYFDLHCKWKKLFLSVIINPIIMPLKDYGEVKLSEPKLKLIIKFKMDSATFTCMNYFYCLMNKSQQGVKATLYMYFILDYNFYTSTYHMVKSTCKPSSSSGQNLSQFL